MPGPRRDAQPPMSRPPRDARPTFAEPRRDAQPPMAGPRRDARPTFAERRASIAERRARRAEVDDPAEVLEAAAHLLENRSRTTADVRRRLTDQGYQAALVERAVQRLVELGYLDDAAFARAWVESRDRARPRGARALRDELRRKGVTADDAEAALAGRAAGAERASDEDGSGQPGELGATGPSPALAPGERADSGAADEAAAARLLARRGAALSREPDPRRRRQRAYALLARNGFDPSVAASAVTAWLAAGAGQPDDPDDPDGEGVGSP